MVASTMNYDQAMEEVLKLKDQGKTYPQIENFLKKAGYVSARTKKPIGALAVRYMVNSHAEKIKARNPENVEPKIEAKNNLSPIDQALEAAKHIIDLKEIPNNIKITMLESLVQQAKNVKKKR